MLVRPELQAGRWRIPRFAAIFCAASLCVAGAVVPTHAQAAELVMFEQQNCHWCEAWHAEIGPIYPKTRESQLAPLRRVDIHGTMPDDLADIDSGRFTPTFVLVENGHEIGRIRGYPGEDFFWGLLDELMHKAQLPEDSKAVPPQGT
ncbi:MAG: thioredoxin [Rhizobiaceae bacterium]